MFRGGLFAVLVLLKVASGGRWSFGLPLDQSFYKPPAAYFAIDGLKTVVGRAGDHVAIQFWAPIIYPWERYVAECTFAPRNPRRPAVSFTVLRREDGYPFFERAPFGERGTLIYPSGTRSCFMTFGIEPAETRDSGTYTCVTRSGYLESPPTARKLRVRNNAKNALVMLRNKTSTA